MNGAAAAMAISPTPAGQAKYPGNRFKVYNTRNANPPNLQACTPVINGKSMLKIPARNRSEMRNAIKNNPTGMTIASKMGIGKLPAGRRNAPRQPSVSAVKNHKNKTDPVAAPIFEKGSG